MNFRNFRAPWAGTTPKRKANRKNWRGPWKSTIVRALQATHCRRPRTGQALGLADKIDTLVGIFAIEQRPTGAKDPFGLRRAALGVIAHPARGSAGSGSARIAGRSRRGTTGISGRGGRRGLRFSSAERLRGLLVGGHRHHRPDARRRVRESPALAARCVHPPAGAEGILVHAGGRESSRPSTSASPIS